MIPSNDRPRLREDLVAEAIEDRGARFIDVIDPDNGNSYRFYDVEYSLACAMDGERDIPGLVRWAQEELGIAPTAGELQNVIATLGDLGYLDRVDSRADGRADGRPGLAAGVVAASPVSAPSSGIDVELGHFQAAQPAAAKAEPAAELELGAPGSARGSLELEIEEPAEVALGPSGAAAPSLPVPAARPARAETPLPVPTPERRVPEAAVAARRPSEQQVRAPGRSTEMGVRPSEQAGRPAAPPARTSQPRLRPSEQQVQASAPASTGASDPSLNLSLPIRPDDVKEAVRASREMRSVDVPPELMAALEAAEQPAGSSGGPGSPGSGPVRSRPATAPPIAASALPPAASVRPSSAVPSASILDPIAPLSASAPLSVSEPISPPSVPPLVPVPRAESRSEKVEARPAEPRRESKPEVRADGRAEVRTKSEPRLEYPRAAEQRPALTPAPREPAPPVATPLPDVPQKRSSMWIVAVLVVAILGVVGFGVWRFVLNKKAPAPVQTTEPVAVAPQPPVTPTEPPPAPPAPSTKLSLVKDPSISVKMPAAGALKSVVADGSAVKEGDEVARLAGPRALEQNIASAKGDLEKRYPADITRLKAKLAAAPNSRQAQAELAAREARVAQRTKELEGYKAELDKLVIKAPTAGKITVIAKAGARLAAEAEVVSIDPEPHLSGAVDLGAPTTAQAGDSITVKAKDGAATATCTLETVQGAKVSFHCPVTEGFADGTEVTVEAK